MSRRLLLALLLAVSCAPPAPTRPTPIDPPPPAAPLAPSIRQFTAAPTEGAWGEPVVLTIATLNATACRVEPGDAVPCDTWYRATPTGTRTDYTLVATSPGGEVRRTITVLRRPQHPTLEYRVTKVGAVVLASPLSMYGMLPNGPAECSLLLVFPWIVEYWGEVAADFHPDLEVHFHVQPDAPVCVTGEIWRSGVRVQTATQCGDTITLHVRD